MTETIQTSQQPKALRSVAMFLSYVLHPVFMPTVMTWVLYKLSPISFAGLTLADIKVWLFRIGYITLFFPLFTVLLLKAVGFAKSFRMETIQERIAPLMATMIFYFWASHVADSISSPHTPLILEVLLLGSFWGIIVLFMLNIFVKVSLHTAAAGGVIGILIVLMMISPVNMVIPFFIALIIAGLIGTLRLILNAHTPAEVWLGYIVGLLVQLGAYWFMR
jgi:hypothetical protein